MSERFISVEEAVDRVGLSKTHLYRLIAAGEFPRTIPIGRFRVAFVESEIDSWMAEKINARDQVEERDRRLKRAATAGRSHRVNNH